MKKTLYRITSLILLAVTLLSHSYVYAQSSFSEGITYTNNELGFSLIIPTSWFGRYSVIEGSQVTFIHTASKDKLGSEAGILFYIKRYEGSMSPEEAWDGPGERYLAAQSDMFSYVLAYPSGVEYTDETEAEYKQMSKDIATILQTVKSIPIIDTNGSTYGASEKPDDGDLANSSTKKGNLAAVYSFDSIILSNGKEVDLRGNDTLLFLNGTPIIDYEIIIRNDRALVPVRLIAQELGASVDWNGSSRVVTITKPQKEIVLTINSNAAFVNRIEINLDYPAMIYKDLTYVPLRFAVPPVIPLKVAISLIPLSIKGASISASSRGM